jgi:hypothetical protein
MAYEKKAMTAFAQAALAASDLINNKFADTRLDGKVQRTVQVEAPQVESTGGGRQARESIVLRPESGDPSGAITAGFLDVGLRSCELRSYAALNAAHRARFQTALDLHQSAYEKFLGELTTLLEGEGFVIRIVEAEERQAKAAAADAAEATSSPKVMLAIGAVAALVVIGLVVVLLIR